MKKLFLSLMFLVYCLILRNTICVAQPNPRLVQFCNDLNFRIQNHNQQFGAQEPLLDEDLMQTQPQIALDGFFGEGDRGLVFPYMGTEADSRTYRMELDERKGTCKPYCYKNSCFGLKKITLTTLHFLAIPNPEGENAAELCTEIILAERGHNETTTLRQKLEVVINEINETSFLKDYLDRSPGYEKISSLIIPREKISIFGAFLDIVIDDL